MTCEPIHSGKELYGNLNVLGMSGAELCRWIGVPGEPFTEILYQTAMSKTHHSL